MGIVAFLYYSEHWYITLKLYIIIIMAILNPWLHSGRLAAASIPMQHVHGAIYFQMTHLQLYRFYING